jgi:hypothetical protein
MLVQPKNQKPGLLWAVKTGSNKSRTTPVPHDRIEV